MKAQNAVRCVQCGEEIDAKARGHAQRVLGWSVNRDAGGANMIALPERRPEWLCRFCLEKRRKGWTWDQLSLFGDPEP